MSEAPLPLPVRLGLGAVVLLRYVSVPRVVVWRVRTPRLAETDEACESRTRNTRPGDPPCDLRRSGPLRRS